MKLVFAHKNTLEYTWLNIYLSARTWDYAEWRDAPTIWETKDHKFEATSGNLMKFCLKLKFKNVFGCSSALQFSMGSTPITMCKTKQNPEILVNVTFIRDQFLTYICAFTETYKPHIYTQIRVHKYIKTI